MPKYRYDKLLVMCFEKREFPIDRLRDAVEYLETVPESKFTGLIAESSVRAGEFRLRAQPMLAMREISGKTPAQVWASFDRKVREEITSLERRFGVEVNHIMRNRAI